MVKVVISGYGKMGHMIEKTIEGREDIVLVEASEDITKIDSEVAKESICIDFTTPAAFRANYGFLAEHFKAVVVGTTGWYDIKDEVFTAFENAGTPLVWASNFSIGVNVFEEAVAMVAKRLKVADYKPYIVEKHHIHKLDAPSGTAKILADAVESGLGQHPDIASVRVGELAGTHTVGFEGMNDRITMEHEAFSRQGFADGAVTAAVVADGLKPGIYMFKDLLFGQTIDTQEDSI